MTREEVAVFQATDSGVNRRDEEESEKLLCRARLLVCCKISYLVGKMAQSLFFLSVNFRKDTLS